MESPTHSAPAALERPDGRSLVVVEKTLIAASVVSIRLRRIDGGRLPDWTPGAHIDLILPNGVTRQYSLCGDPADSGEYRIAVLREAAGRGGSRFIHDLLTVGDRVGLGGPRNNFTLVPSASYTFIAGGIGITPILPMLRAAEALGSRWRLLYLGRDLSTMALVDELTVGSGDITLHPASERGRIPLAEWIGSYDEATKVYACGPARLLESVADATRTWRPGWVRSERFTARTIDEPLRATPFEVQVFGTDITVGVGPGTSVAAALRGAGIDILTSCARGVCGTCETTVVSGEPDHRDSILSDAEQAAGDCFFPCVSRSRSDRIVIAV
ncbi:MAG: PDR/VanB family oxidoreductase [Leifsonia flava]